MKKLEFDSLEHMKSYLDSEEGIKESNRYLAKTIMESIDTKLKSVKVFEIYLAEEDVEVTVLVARVDWINTLQGCLEVFGKYEMGDEGIDTYLAIKKLKEKN